MESTTLYCEELISRSSLKTQRDGSSESYFLGGIAVAATMGYFPGKWAQMAVRLEQEEATGNLINESKEPSP